MRHSPSFIHFNPFLPFIPPYSNLWQTFHCVCLPAFSGLVINLTTFIVPFRNFLILLSCSPAKFSFRHSNELLLHLHSPSRPASAATTTQARSSQPLGGITPLTCCCCPYIQLPGLIDCNKSFPSLTSLGEQAPPAPPPPPPQVYYSSAPIPEPVKHNYWYGATKAEVDAQEAADAAAATAAAEQAHSVQLVLIPQIVAAPAPAPAPPAPKPQQFYCRELDGSYTLRTTTEIMQTLQPGHWTHAPSGYPYWVRTA